MTTPNKIPLESCRCNDQNISPFCNAHVPLESENVKHLQDEIRVLREKLSRGSKTLVWPRSLKLQIMLSNKQTGAAYMVEKNIEESMLMESARDGMNTLVLRMAAECFDHAQCL